MADTNTSSFAIQQGSQALLLLNNEIVRTLKSGGADEIHDLRVAIRRFRRVLQVLKPCFPVAESSRIRRSLKQIMHQAGDVRDLDIAARLLTKVALSAENPVDSQIELRREAARQTLIASLRRWMQRKLDAGWRKALRSETSPVKKGHGDSEAEFGATSVKAIAKRILPAMAKDYFGRGREAARHGASVHEMHKFRIAAKNLRYTLDVFGPVYGESLAGLIEQLKDVQTLLGDINDCATVRRMLSRDKLIRGEGGSKILAALKKRQHKKTAQFRGDARQFSDASVLREWKHSLRSVGTPAAGAKKKATADRASRSTGKRRPS